MSEIKTINQDKSVSNSPFLILQLWNLIILFCIMSPVLLAGSMILLSFVFQNFKGFIYLGFLIAACVVRFFVYTFYGNKPLQNEAKICNVVQYSKYANGSFSCFVFAFTITYLSIPMFSNNSVNYSLFCGLLVWFILDMFTKLYKNCASLQRDVFLNLLLGVALSSFFVISMYAGNSGEYLFFNEVSSNKEICTMPKKQTFKCAVYKNGVLVSGTP